MERAVVSIGVKKTGGLPELQAAVQSAKDVADWAKIQQRIPEERVKLITDAAGAVGRDRIFEAIEEFTQLGFIEQLIVYFSGHGINSGRFEQWLLSRAPEDPNAAVNVKGSEFAARFCGLGHVVLISDACRTAADSIQAQSVSGGEIFPNIPPTGPERPVDQFFATLVGNPALEVRSVAESSSRFRAAYSTVFLDALKGAAPAIVEATPAGRFVRPRPLKRHLSTAVPAFLAGLGLPGGTSQQPDARVESEDDAWVAQLFDESAAGPESAGVPPLGAGVRRRRSRGGRAITGDEELPPPLLSGPDTSRGLVTEARDHLAALLRPTAGAKRRSAASSPRSSDRRLLDRAIGSASSEFGPDHFETECGIKVRGTRVLDAHAHRNFATVRVGDGRDVVQVNLTGARPAVNTVVTVDDNSVVVVPAFRGYVTGLVFDEQGQLDDVSYEPSANTALGRAYADAAVEVRALRAAIAASSSLGVFRLDDEQDAGELVQRMRSMKALDPALAVYAAYACHDRRMRAEIADMGRHLERDLHARVFDVAMLAFSMSARGAAGDNALPVYPFVPMLTQGWALLSPLGITLAGRLDSLRGHLRTSLWTHFDPPAADLLLWTINKGEVG